jgi:type IV pilus assembly protein PilQ
MNGSPPTNKLAWMVILGATFLLAETAYTAQLPELVVQAPEVAVAKEIKSDSDDKLSFNFQNIEVRALLQLIAKNSGMNFIINEAVKGNITLNLKNVTWEQALNIILKTQGLTSRRMGNVIYVSTIDDITSNETKQLQSDATISNLAPLKSVMVRLKYTNATDLAGLLKGTQSTLLTARGQVAVDSRTNSLIIRDTKENLTDILPEIKKLDVPARQVLIEARIVNIDTTYEEELGVRFGASDTRHFSGTLSGANQLTQGTNASGVTPYTDRLNFNVPANQLFDGQTPGTIAMALVRVGHALLDLELSALEGERHAQIIARPRVVTSNQQKAMIQTGEEIPYQESTSSGATSVVFKNAVLSLEIVPQITPDNKIILNLKATEDTRGTNTAVGAASDGTPITIPAINTQAVQSLVLLNNNETIVLGGVYRKIKTNTLDRIPFFGTLPIVGSLFTKTGEHDEKHELLIFITPTIINAKSSKIINAAVKGEA